MSDEKSNNLSTMNFVLGFQGGVDDGQYFQFYGKYVAETSNWNQLVLVDCSFGCGKVTNKVDDLRLTLNAQSDSLTGNFNNAGRRYDGSTYSIQLLFSKNDEGNYQLSAKGKWYTKPIASDVVTIVFIDEKSVVHVNGDFPLNDVGDCVKYDNILVAIEKGLQNLAADKDNKYAGFAAGESGYLWMKSALKNYLYRDGTDGEHGFYSVSRSPMHSTCFEIFSGTKITNGNPVGKESSTFYEMLSNLATNKYKATIGVFSSENTAYYYDKIDKVTTVFDKNSIYVKYIG